MIAMTIPFNARLFSKTPYVEEEHAKFVVPGTFVKFTILDNGRVRLGLIKKVENDVVYAANVKTGGEHAFKKSSINSIFLTKVRGKLRNKYLKVMETTGDSDIGYLDSAIDRIIAKVRTDHAHVRIDDQKKDTLKAYNRLIKFTNGDKFIMLEIPKTLNKAIITSSLTDRKSSIRVHKGKVNIMVVLNKIELIK